jgi:transcription antitermination factor NusG
MGPPQNTPTPPVQIGDTVRVRHGTFAQMTGKVVDFYHNTRDPMVRLSIWNRSVDVRLDPSQVERL